MSCFKHYRLHHAIGVSLLALAIATDGHAQTTPDSTANSTASSNNETIVVNARRREEPLQQAPVAVSYLSGKALEIADVRRVTDLTSMVPNLSINSGYRQGSLWISLRGIPSVQGGEPPVTVLIDGVQVPGQDFINEELDDIASVQVLRGPQGAIYGRGAIGGAILIDTQKPTDKWHGSADLLYGRHNDFRGSATIAGPIVSDKVLARITLLGRRTDGLQPNFTTGKYADAGHAINVSGELLFNLDHGLTIDLNARHQKGVDGASYEYLVTDANRYDYNTVGTVTDPNVEDHHNINAVSAKIEKTLDTVILTSITQFARSASRVLGDTDFSAAHNSVQDNFITSRAWNEDLRIASADHGQALNWLLGGFFQDRMVVNKLVVSGDPLGSTPGVIFQNSDQHDKSVAWAIYGQASYKLPAGFELSVAARYDQDRRKSYDPLSADSEVRNNFSSFQPAVTLKKQFNSNINAYATIGRGFRSGGFNPYADTVALGVDRKYKSETSTNYELGLKTTWLDKKLTINLAAYHNVYDNQQLFFISINPVARDIYNIDKTHINGGEIEISYRPTKDLSINGNVGVSHSTIKKFSAAMDVNGNRSPQSYSDTSSLSFTYTPKLTEDIGAIFYGDWERRGKIYWDAQNQYKTDPASTFDARVGLTYKDYELAFFMRNISNKRFPVLFQANAAGPGVHGQLLNMPRTYGVELRAKF